VFLCVLCGTDAWFGVFQGRLISDEEMSTTVAEASGSERYVGKSEHCAGWVCFFSTTCISRFPAFAENDDNGWKCDFSPERQTPDWRDLTGP
jgi:hypothetical protein